MLCVNSVDRDSADRDLGQRWSPPNEGAGTNKYFAWINRGLKADLCTRKANHPWCLSVPRSHPNLYTTICYLNKSNSFPLIQSGWLSQRCRPCCPLTSAFLVDILLLFSAPWESERLDSMVPNKSFFLSTELSSLRIFLLPGFHLLLKPGRKTFGTFERNPSTLTNVRFLFLIFLSVNSLLLSSLPNSTPNFRLCLSSYFSPLLCCLNLWQLDTSYRLLRGRNLNWENIPKSWGQ